MLRTEIDDRVAVVTLDRPDRLNALSWAMMDRIRAELESLGGRDDIGAVVLTGAGRAFCAGADLRDFAASPDLPGEVARHLDATMAPLARAILGLPVPVLAAVNGPCAGGGLGLALLTDIVIAARGAYFLVPQVLPLGGVPDLGTTWILGRLVGRARALGMSLSGERIGAETAERWGMIWRCVPDGEAVAETVGVARRLATAPAAVVATRELIDAGFAEGADASLALETRHQSARFADPAVAEFVKRFAR